VFRPKKNRIKLYNTLAVPTLLYGSENLTIKGREATRITAADIKYMRITAGCTWDRSQNKYRDCKGIKYNPSFRQNTGLQEKTDICKSNAT
jgi:hypothetical protein